jgi:diguanylate cyclase (GGDEF)-like protein
MTVRRFIDAASSVESSAEWPLFRVGERSTVWVHATSTVVDSEFVNTAVVVLTEIDARKALEAGLLHRASHDPLTGLLNRGAFMTGVGDACERASAEFAMCAVLYLDLDHFKEINDEFGHQTGDHVLAAVGRRLRACLRPSDMLARLGGDELGVLCPVLDTEGEAIRLAERIVATVGQPFTIDEQVLHTGVSVGVAFSNGAGLAAVDLIGEADHAMYRAKAAGRARWATMQSQAPASAPSDSVEVGRIDVAVGHLEDQLDLLIRGLDPRSSDWDRLAQASRALARARSVLIGGPRIG